MATKNLDKWAQVLGVIGHEAEAEAEPEPTEPEPTPTPEPVPPAPPADDSEALLREAEEMLRAAERERDEARAEVERLREQIASGAENDVEAEGLRGTVEQLRVEVERLTTLSQAEGEKARLMEEQRDQAVEAGARAAELAEQQERTIRDLREALRHAETAPRMVEAMTLESLDAMGPILTEARRRYIDVLLRRLENHSELEPSVLHRLDVILGHAEDLADDVDADLYSTARRR